MEVTHSPENNPKQRHGCVTAWLIYMIIANALSGLIYIIAGDKVKEAMQVDLTGINIVSMALLSFANVVFAVMLLKWQKMGFWGFVITSIAGVFVNLSIGLGVSQSILGLIGIGILYAILQIPKEKVSAWSELE